MTTFSLFSIYYPLLLPHDATLWKHFLAPHLAVKLHDPREEKDDDHCGVHENSFEQGEKIHLGDPIGSSTKNHVGKYGTGQHVGNYCMDTSTK